MDRPLPFQSILITGADGFVGRKLARRLATLAREARLTLCMRAATADAVGMAVPFDLTSDTSVAGVVAAARPDLVVHLAAQSSVAGSVSGALSTWQVNVGGSMRLASALAALPSPATLLFASSADVYGLSFNEGSVDETVARRPRSVYARSKAAAEDALGDLLPADSRLIVARPGNHSGPGQDARFVLPSFAEQIAAIEVGCREPVLHVGDLNPQRDFLHVDDVIDAYLALIAAAPSLPGRSIFNVASGRPVAIRALLETLLAHSETTVAVKVDSDRQRAENTPRLHILADRLRATTGWRPTRSHDDMLRDILADKRQHVARGEVC